MIGLEVVLYVEEKVPSPEKRTLLKSMNLKISLSDIVPAICGQIPQDELIYRFEFTDPSRSGYVEDEYFTPPLLPSELIISPQTKTTTHHQVNVSDEKIHVYTKIVEKTKQGPIATEKKYSFSILDLLDP